MCSTCMSCVQGSVGDIGHSSHPEELRQHGVLVKHLCLLSTPCTANISEHMLSLTLRSSLSTSGYLLSTKKLLRCSTSLTLP